MNRYSRWTNWFACAVSTLSCTADGCVGHLLYSLQALVPSLLRREVEVALENLGLAWDRTYAWDMFLDMMVRPGRHSRASSCWILRLGVLLKSKVSVLHTHTTESASAPFPTAEAVTFTIAF